MTQHQSMVERIKRDMRRAEQRLIRQRYAAKRTKRQPYGDFQRHKLSAMARAAIKAVRAHMAESEDVVGYIQAIYLIDAALAEQSPAQANPENGIVRGEGT
jgi:hypothetical protein